MPADSVPTREAASPRDPEPRSRAQLYRRIYPLRVLGMGLGGLAIASVLYTQGSPAWSWWLLGLSCFAWPHLSFALARSSADSYQQEKRNLLLDSAIAGMWVPLMHFSVLPSVVLLTVSVFDKLGSGIRRLWLHSLAYIAVAMAAAAIWTRPQPQWESAFLVVLCTLPLMVVHALASGMSSYRLIRLVSRQNHELRELRRTDAQTSLYAREHWMQRAQAALQDFHASGEPACLMMIDIDHFKAINDLHGHTVGDEAIAAVGRIIRDCVRAGDIAGRYGGDEFAVVCLAIAPDGARDIANRIRSRVESLRLEGWPDLHLTSSIGMAAAAGTHRELREWLNAADVALYDAKRAGRNQIAGTAPVPATSA